METCNELAWAIAVIYKFSFFHDPPFKLFHDPLAMNGGSEIEVEHSASGSFFLSRFLLSVRNTAPICPRDGDAGDGTSSAIHAMRSIHSRTVSYCTAPHWHIVFCTKHRFPSNSTAATAHRPLNLTPSPHSRCTGQNFYPTSTDCNRVTCPLME